MAEASGRAKTAEAVPAHNGRRLMIVAFLLAAALAVYQLAAAYYAPPPVPVPAEAEP